MNKVIKIWLLSLFIVPFTLHANNPFADRDDLVTAVRVPKSVAPGQFETFILQLSNDFDYPLRLEVQVDKPASWHFLSRLDEIRLQPGESRQVIFLLEIARSCEVGKKKVHFRFVDHEHQVQLQENIITEVENIHQLRVQTLRKPKNLSSGEEFSVDFEIINLGNCVEEVRVSSLQGRPDSSHFFIPPNSRRIVSVKQEIPANLSQAGYVSCDLTVDADYLEQPIRALASIKAFPRATLQSDPYYRFPLEASLIYFGAQNRSPYQSSLQYELKGNGYLDRNKRHSLNFTLRAPNRFAITRVGNYDQYSADYSWKRSRTASINIRLGDFAYKLTDLTEMYRWARGMEISFKDEKYEAGAFINQPRFIGDINYQYAAWGRYNFNDRWYGQLGLIEKHYAYIDETATIGSLKGGLDLEHHSFEAELSSGSIKSEGGYAAQISGRGEHKGFQYNSRSLYAGPNYPGFYTNSVYSSNSLQYRHQQYALYGNLYYNASNPGQDTTFTTAPYSSNYSLGLGYFPNKELQLRVDYLHRSREDRMPSKKFSYRENGIRYRLTFRNKKWFSQLDGEAAETENLLVQSDSGLGKTYNLRLQLERNFFSDLRLGINAQYLNTNRYGYEQQSFLLYGAHLSYQLNKNFSLRAAYNNNYLLEEYYRDRSLLDLGLNASTGSHSLSLTTSHALVRNTVERTDFYVNAKYSYRFAPPISKRKDLYSLQGQIRSINPEDAAGVILRINGQAVISDEYGRFAVHNLPTGIHYLHIDWGSVKVGMTTTADSPLEVEILPRSTNKVVFELIRGANIEGKLNFVARNNDENEPRPRKIIKISNGEREFLTYTDNEGNFSFINILPGNWKLRMVNAHEGNGEWELMQNNINLRVKSGETAAFNFEMRKRERKIRFSDKTLNLKLEKQ